MHGRPASGRRLWAIAIAIAVLLAGGVASASATVVDFRSGDGRFTTDRYVVTGSAEENEIEIGYEAGADEFVISDTSERVESSACDRLSQHRVRCGNDSYELIAKGEAGGDRITFSGAYGTFGQVNLWGGDGDDVLVGGALEQDLTGGPGRDHAFGGSGGDFVGGGPGRDVLRGGGGDDFVGETGNEDGADRLFGGPGSDDLSANQDNGRDARIDCGPGDRDEARIEKVDPKPVGCERVRVIG
jgi:Ca2+-binding RTX toxin-like protein